jgi:hypothetical protein
MLENTRQCGKMTETLQRAHTTRPLSPTLPKSFLERINYCSLGRLADTINSNCIGTALFITGEIKEERVIYPETAYRDHLRTLARNRKPKVGCLVAWHRGYTAEHMAVIINTEPLLVAHRLGAFGQFLTNVPFEEVDDTNFIKVYYLPTALRK